MTDLDCNKTDFYSQIFSAENFNKKIISGKEFDGCSFKSCDFSEATFSNCKFTDCHFIACNLSILKVDNSIFSDVEFVDCKLIGVNWIKACWRGLTLGIPLKFKRCLINSSSFFGLTLTNIVIDQCRAHDVDFRKANLSGASFSHTDLTNSIFNNTNLMGANFNEAENYDININNNVIKNASFCRYEAVRLLEHLGIKLIG